MAFLSMYVPRSEIMLFSSFGRHRSLLLFPILLFLIFAQFELCFLLLVSYLLGNLSLAFLTQYFSSAGAHGRLRHSRKKKQNTPCDEFLQIIPFSTNKGGTRRRNGVGTFQ